MKILLGMIVGAIAGILLARYFWFDALEVEFSQMIIENGLPDFDFLVKTETFKKSVISLAVGAILGLFGSVTLFPSRK
ncbi:MAG: hypothetical protein KZQ58_09555 [gamma proteobacterium symbiont of Bathyaustriella thionipta]|nr:hypothetical protein [gamma proteobacterium symbiont of Bathyaustriella thionipta]